MHPQYIGDLGDGENTPEFPMLDSTPFQRLTDLRSDDSDLPRNLHRESQFPNRETYRTLVTFLQILGGADVHRDSPRAKLRCKLTTSLSQGQAFDRC